MVTSNKQTGKELPPHLEHINLNAAGIDIGSESHYVAVPEGRDPEKSVREFSSFTCDMTAISTWLQACEVDTVVMESTGVYWIPLYDHLEKVGFDVKLVDARHVKNVSGRKTDVQDCQWLQQLHTYGLLSGAFRPPEQICALRSMIRQRDTLVRYAASHILHMQKALTLMNIKIHNVLSDITGKTGLAIIRLIIAGERDPKKLAALRDGRCKHTMSTIEKSLEGNYRAEHVFSLKQSLELFDVYQAKIKDCDREIESTLKAFEPTKRDGSSLLNGKRKAVGKHGPSFDVRRILIEKSGVDLTQIPGISDMTALSVMSEIGFSVAPWKTAKHFASWMGLCPGNKISGNKILKTKTKVCANKVAAALRLAVTNLWRSQTAMGAYYRRMIYKLGKPGAVTATAHKLARLIYAMLDQGTAYVEAGVESYENAYKQRVLKTLRKRAHALGFDLVEKATELDMNSTAFSIS